MNALSLFRAPLSDAAAPTSDTAQADGSQSAGFSNIMSEDSQALDAELQSPETLDVELKEAMAAFLNAFPDSDAEVLGANTEQDILDVPSGFAATHEPSLKAGALSLSPEELSLLAKGQTSSQAGIPANRETEVQANAQIGTQIGEQTSAQTSAQVTDPANEGVNTQLGAKTKAQVNTQLGTQVNAQTGAQQSTLANSLANTQTNNNSQAGFSTPGAISEAAENNNAENNNKGKARRAPGFSNSQPQNVSPPFSKPGAASLSSQQASLSHKLSATSSGEQKTDFQNIGGDIERAENHAARAAAPASGAQTKEAGNQEQIESSQTNIAKVDEAQTQRSELQSGNDNRKNHSRQSQPIKPPLQNRVITNEANFPDSGAPVQPRSGAPQEIANSTRQEFMQLSAPGQTPQSGLESQLQLLAQQLESEDRGQIKHAADDLLPLTRLETPLPILNLAGLGTGQPVDQNDLFSSAFPVFNSPLAQTLSNAAPTHIMSHVQSAQISAAGYAQLSQSLIQAAETKKGVAVQLDPPELGRVYIDFQFEAGRQVTAIIRPEFADTSLLLREQTGWLTQTLMASGFDQVNIEFAAPDQQDFAFDQNFGDQDSDAQNGPGETELAPRTLKTELAATPQKLQSRLAYSAGYALGPPLNLKI